MASTSGFRVVSSPATGTGDENSELVAPRGCDGTASWLEPCGHDGGGWLERARSWDGIAWPTTVGRAAGSTWGLPIEAAVAAATPWGTAGYLLDTSGTSSSTTGWPPPSCPPPQATSASASSWAAAGGWGTPSAPVGARSGSTRWLALWPGATPCGIAPGTIGDRDWLIPASESVTTGPLKLLPGASSENAHSLQLATSRLVADRAYLMRTPCSSSRISAALRNRVSGSRDSARSTIASSSGGHAWLKVDGGRTSPRWTLIRVWYSFFDANSGRAVRSSCAITPAEKMSERASSSLPLIASGAM